MSDMCEHVRHDTFNARHILELHASGSLSSSTGRRFRAFNQMRLEPSVHFLVALSPDVIALLLDNPVDFVVLFEY